MSELLKSIDYVEKNKLQGKANILANKVGNIYMACLMLYKNIPLTKENIFICKQIVLSQKQIDNEWWINYLKSYEESV